MKFFSSLIVVLASVTAALAVPVDDSAAGQSKLDKRWSVHLPKTSVSCGNTQFTPVQVAYTIEIAMNLVVTTQQIGRNRYPHVYGNSEGILFHPACTGTLHEFPMLANGARYTGGRNQGAHRVVFQVVKPGVAYYCGLITHEGAPAGRFSKCTRP